MTTLTITRGLPGSGKTTWAKLQRNVWRVNRDEIRAMHTGVWDYNNQIAEGMVTILQEKMIKELLARDKDVIVDDTNLDWRHVRLLLRLASDGVTVVIKEFLHVPVEVCIERDALRPDPVGREVIMGMYRKYMEG